MFTIPAHKQTNPAHVPGQIVNPVTLADVIASTLAADAQEAKLPIVGNSLGRKWQLFHEGSMVPAFFGEALVMRDGVAAKLVGGSSPHHAGSSGRVWVQYEDAAFETEYFPGVIGCKWVAL